MDYVGLQRLEHLQFLCLIERVVKRILIEQLHPQQSEIERRCRGRIVRNLRRDGAEGRLEKAAGQITGGIFVKLLFEHRVGDMRETMGIGGENADNRFMRADPVNLGQCCKQVVYIRHYPAGHHEFSGIIRQGNALANIADNIHTGV